MPENFRQFEVSDPFGRVWQVEFRWQQNAISIRHCDAVDCKYYISNGEERREIVVSLMHPDLLDLARTAGRELTDAWCIRLAGLHIEHMISTWEDMEKTIITVSPSELARHNSALQEIERRDRERASSSR